MTAPAIEDALFLFSAVPLVGFGLGATFHPRLRSLPLISRLGAAYGFGALGLTVEGLLFSLAHIPWSIGTLGIPLALLSFGTAWIWRDHRTERVRTSSSWMPPSFIVSALSATSLALMLVISAATSVDFLLFYGVKAVRFALARGIDLSLLKGPFTFHVVPEYPPLMPIVQAFGVLFAGRLPWRVAPMISWIWFVALLVLLPPLLRRRMSAGAANAVTAFWAAALSLSLASSYSGGNGEAPLLFYETVAGLLLLTESPGEPATRWFSAVALAGAVLTKQEGSIAGVLFAAGVILRDFLEGRAGAVRRAIPLVLVPGLGLALWFGFQWLTGLHVGFRPQTELGHASFGHLRVVLREGLANLKAGSAGFAWILPIALLILSGTRIRAALPAIVFSGGVLGALLWTYLGGSAMDVQVRIGWTLPRASQPALSMLILGAAVAWFSSSTVEQSRSGHQRNGDSSMHRIMRRSYRAAASPPSTRSIASGYAWCSSLRIRAERLSSSSPGRIGIRR